MELYNLKYSVGSKKKKKRVGRGGCRGGTSCRGNNGNKSRSGYKSKVGFEGGQTPLYKKLPIIHSLGKRLIAKCYISLDRLIRLANDGVVSFDLDVLKSCGVLKKNIRQYKVVLGKEKLSKGITIHANGFSKSVQEVVEKENGGKCIVL